MDEHKDFDNYISINYLRDIYDNHVILSASTGIDNMSHKILLGIIDEQLSIINRKFNSKSYVFTKYKLKLISKGRGKPPREISIPTIRDKIALRAICDYLKSTYDNELRFKLPQDVIKSVKADIESGEYNYFLKLDVANFFPSVQHDKLIEQLCHRIDDNRVLTLISSAIKSPTVIKPSKSDVPNVNGIPQGLSISSILASIYLHTLDNKY
ncbi:reverse transcriptase domain-containing protein, partial [Citrobacter freundii]|nr:RNA-dependent DNA polymerase [Citrobacter freundii]